MRRSGSQASTTTSRLGDVDQPLVRKIAAVYPVSNMVVIRKMFVTGRDGGLVDRSPVVDLRLTGTDGWAVDDVMSVSDLSRLSDGAPVAHARSSASVVRVAPQSVLHSVVHAADETIFVPPLRRCTAMRLPHIVDELRRLPRRTDIPTYSGRVSR